MMSCERNTIFEENCYDEIVKWLRAESTVEEDSELERQIIDNYIALRYEGHPPSIARSIGDIKC
jgi:hypothetical protein